MWEYFHVFTHHLCQYYRLHVHTVVCCTNMVQITHVNRCATTYIPHNLAKLVGYTVQCTLPVYLSLPHYNYIEIFVYYVCLYTHSYLNTPMWQT